MAEDIDDQLKRMTQDLTDIIGQMNMANAAQEEDSAVSEELCLARDGILCV